MAQYDKPKQNPEQEQQRDAQKRPKHTDSKSPVVEKGDRGPHVDRVGMPTSDDANDGNYERGTD